MRALVQRLRALLRHPEKRRADAKRALEKICRDEGTSRTQAHAIASRFLAKGGAK